MAILPMLMASEEGENMNFELTESGKDVLAHYCTVYDEGKTPRENIEAAIGALLENRGLAARTAKRRAHKICDDLGARESRAYTIHAFIFDDMRKRLKI